MAQIENTAISNGERLMLSLDAWNSVIRLSPMIAFDPFHSWH
jgi:hypothetical protein